MGTFRSSTREWENSGTNKRERRRRRKKTYSDLGLGLGTRGLGLGQYQASFSTLIIISCPMTILAYEKMNYYYFSNNKLLFLFFSNYIYIFPIIYYNILISEFIQNVAYDNYDDFQHVNFIPFFALHPFVL
jgi:hypothetical protein